MADARAAMIRFLAELGARPVRADENYYVLDGFSHDCYLVFDTTECPDDPDSTGTVDLFVATPGSQPLDSDERILVAPKLRRQGVMRFLFAMGVQRFSEQTKKQMYALTSVLRTQ